MKTTQVQVRRQVLHPETPPVAFHLASMALVSHDLVLEFGHYDLPELDAVLRGQSDHEVTVNITTRVSCSPGQALGLLNTLLGMCQDLVAKQVIKPEDLARVLSAGSPSP